MKYRFKKDVSTWEFRRQDTWLEPLSESEAGAGAQPENGDETVQTPRANIVVSQQEIQASQTAVDARDEFLDQSAQAIPELEILDLADTPPSERTDGATVRLSFQATEQLRLAQMHVFLVDAGVLTQIVATVAEAQADRLDAGRDLHRLVASIVVEAADGS